MIIPNPINSKNTVSPPLFIPKMESLLFDGNRPDTVQQIPCKTINEITYPPARTPNLPLIGGYKSALFGHGDKVTNENRVFYSPQFPLNNPILVPTKTYT